VFGLSAAKKEIAAGRQSFKQLLSALT